jgi:hypothetical protein
MKAIQFFAAALAATTLLASCVKEDANGIGNENAKGQETYAGVNIMIPVESVGTRAEDSSVGAAGEKTINTIGVYIVDSEGSFDYEVFDVSSFAETTIGGRRVFTMQAGVKTVTGSKKVFVVANPKPTAAGTSNLQTKIEAMRATAINAVGTTLPVSDFMTLTGAGNATKVTGMVMSGAIHTAFDLGVQTNDNTPGTGALDAANIKNVVLERNLAKVVLREGTTYTVVDGTTTLTWQLGGAAKDAYLISQTAATPASTSLYATPPAGALDATTGNTHTYWNNFTSLKTASVPNEWIAVQNNTAYSNGKAAEYPFSKFCFENYRTATDRFAGNTTTAIIKGVFVPTVVVKNYTANAPVQGISTDADTDGSFWLNKKNNTYWNTVAKTAAVTSGDYVEADFAYYAAGVGYYTIYVQDANNDVGVKRNSYYLLDINEVRGPGRPEIDVDPNEPLEADTYLAISAEVKHWDFQNSSHNIQ